MTTPGDEEPTEADTPRSGTDAVPVQHDWLRYDRPSVAVVDAVAATTGRTTTDLPSLHDALDPDALDDFLTARGDAPYAHRSVSFTYAGVEVAVESDGSIEVHPRSAEFDEAGDPDR